MVKREKENGYFIEYCQILHTVVKSTLSNIKNADMCLLLVHHSLRASRRVSTCCDTVAYLSSRSVRQLLLNFDRKRTPM